MNIYSIYKITNRINSKVYIGFSKDPIGRIKDHLKSKRTQILYHAIAKYGWENFDWEIIYQSYDLDHTLNTMEPFFINEYNSFIDSPNSNGYNMTTGGSKFQQHCNKSKKLISDATKRQWKNKEYVKKMLEYNRTKWSNPDFLSRRLYGWKIIYPDNTEIIILNLAKFCRDHNIDGSSMIGVSKVVRRSAKGYKCERILLTSEHKTNDYLW